MKKFKQICANTFYFLIQIVFWYILFDFVIFKYVIHINSPFWISEERSKYLHPYAYYISPDIAISDNKSIYYNSDKSLFNDIDKNDIKVAFFAGSTGVVGKPRIADELQKKLSLLLNRDVKVVNFSVNGAVHTQFLHMMIEYFDEQFIPDIIVFYCGNNELEINLSEDPRPGYPEWFYYSESPEWLKFLINYSALFAKIFDYKRNFIIKDYNLLTNRFLSDNNEFIERETKNYFSVIEKANFYTNYLKSDNLKKPVFLAFFQPFKSSQQELDETYNLYIQSIKKEITNYNYIFDVHNAYDDLPLDIWYDYVHVHGDAHIKMASIIADAIYKKIINENLLKQ